MRHLAVVSLLLLLGGVLRVVFVLVVHPLGDSIYSDMANYVGIASDIGRGVWHPGSFFQPIGYPLLIAGVMRVTDQWLLVISWINILASTLTMGLLWLIASRSFGRGVGLASLAMAAIHLPWIVFAGFAMPETVFTLCLVLICLATWRLATALRLRDGFLWGLAFLAGFLFKGTHVPLVVLVCVFLLLREGRAARRAVLTVAAVVVAGLLAHGFLAWTTTGHFQPTPSASGLNLVEGKCPAKDNQDSNGARWLSPLYVQLGRTEQKVWDQPFTDSSYFTAAGLGCIVANPWVLVQSLEGIPFLFVGNWLWPRSAIPFDGYLQLYEMVFSLWAIVGLAAATLLSGDRMHSTRVFASWGLPVAALFLSVYVFKSEIRFRVPFDVVIIPLAMVGWRDLWRARAAFAALGKSEASGGSEG